jgi:hypothetical protein
MTHTYVEMYMNIYYKYGKDSAELRKFKEYSAIYQNKTNTMIKIYKNIMKKA